MIKKVKKGFTLIELVVVIAVIAILSAVSVVAYVGITNSAKKSGAESEAKQIVTLVKGGVLSQANGYVEQEYTTAPAYKVQLDGRELKFFEDGETEGTELVDAIEINDVNQTKLTNILKDMLKELGEEGVEPSKVVNEGSTDKVTSILVLISGKESGSTNEKDYGKASF